MFDEIKRVSVEGETWHEMHDKELGAVRDKANLETTA
jgi:hypothetical protein